MASAPEFKVFNPQGEYVAACKFIEDAAMIVSGYGDGASIRHGHAKRDTVWLEGTDGKAGESYDTVVNVVRSRIYARRRAALVRIHGEATVAQWEDDRAKQEA